MLCVLLQMKMMGWNVCVILFACVSSLCWTRGYVMEVVLEIFWGNPLKWSEHWPFFPLKAFTKNIYRWFLSLSFCFDIKNIYSYILTLQEPLFAARVVYDLLFFFIVIIIVLNLIFGVIIDTFADLRSEKQGKEEILKTTCFICGAWIQRRVWEDARWRNAR